MIKDVNGRFDDIPFHLRLDIFYCFVAFIFLIGKNYYKKQKVDIIIVPSIKLTIKNILRENAVKINAEDSLKKKRRKKRIWKI